jgi:hypothetical protein
MKLSSLKEQFNLSSLGNKLNTWGHALTKSCRSTSSLSAAFALGTICAASVPLFGLSVTFAFAAFSLPVIEYGVGCALRVTGSALRLASRPTNPQ